MGAANVNRDNQGTAVGEISPAGETVRAVLDMLSRAENVIDVDPRQASIFIGKASRLLESVSDAPTMAREPYSPRLSSWQEREVMRHIVEHLDQSIRNQDLAETVGLGVTQFSRCFKGSFGISPHGYVIRSRLERAKTLMRQSRSSLCQIALESGFADQAHMSRLFHAIVGSPPNRWRRSQTSSATA